MVSVVSRIDFDTAMFSGMIASSSRVALAVSVRSLVRAWNFSAS